MLSEIIHVPYAHPYIKYQHREQIRFAWKLVDYKIERLIFIKYKAREWKFEW